MTDEEFAAISRARNSGALTYEYKGARLTYSVQQLERVYQEGLRERQAAATGAAVSNRSVIRFRPTGGHGGNGGCW